MPKTKKKVKSSAITFKTILSVATVSVLLFVVLGIFVYYADKGMSQKSASGDVAVASEAYGDVTVKGTAACLPYAGEGPHIDLCATGVKTSSGLYYAVKTTDVFQPAIDEAVEVTGTLSPADDDTYDIEGTIVVK